MTCCGRMTDIHYKHGYLMRAICFSVSLYLCSCSLCFTSADCTVLTATDSTSCAPAVGILLATYDLDFVDRRAAAVAVADAAFQCVDDETQVVAAVDSIVEMKIVGKNVPIVDEASVLQDRASPDSGGMSGGGIAGVVILSAALLAGAVFLAYRHHNKNKQDPADYADEEDEAGDEEEAVEEVAEVTVAKDLAGDATVDTMEDMSPDYSPDADREATKEAVLDEIDGVLASIETDMRLQQGGECGEEFEVTL